MEPSDSPLRDAINKLSKKKELISEGARRASSEYDYTDDDDTDVHADFRKKIGLLEEFDMSVRLLTSIFKESNFDELALFVSHPSRVLVINFFIGILRGLGFAVGVMLIIFLIALMVKSTVGPELLSTLF